MAAEDFPTGPERPERPADAAPIRAEQAETEAEAIAPYAGFKPAEFRPAVFAPGLPSSEAVPTDLPLGPPTALDAPPVGTRDLDTGLPTSWAPPVPALATAAADPGAAPPAALAVRSGPSTLNRISEELVAWFKTLFSAAVYATLIVTFGFQVARVEGLSMAPTLEDQDRLIVNKFAYKFFNDPQVGDIVMLYYPIDPEKSFVKRVVGEPGDTLRSVQGRVYRNDVPLPDDFIPEDYRDHDTWGPEIVPPGQYFVMGDHRNNSSDSRTWKWVPKKYIIGKVQLRWWPLNHARLF